MSFWKFITTGIAGAENRLHKKLIYSTSIISFFVAVIFAGLTATLTGGSIPLIALSIALSSLGVYIIGYIVYVEKS